MVLSARQTAKVTKYVLRVDLSFHCVQCYAGSILFTLCRLSQLDTRRILKRLAKENLKQLGRMVAKLSHANPMTVLRTIVHQVLSLLVRLPFNLLESMGFLTQYC